MATSALSNTETGPRLTIAEAAAALSCSADTIRRRIKSGELAAIRDSRGRYLVALNDRRIAQTRQASKADVRHIRRELSHTQELLAEVRRHRDNLEVQLQAAWEHNRMLQRFLVDQQRQLSGLPQFRASLKATKRANAPS